MTQAHLDLYNKILKRSVACQTGQEPEFVVNLDKNKYLRLYYSKRYSQFVLSINYGKCKQYLITKPMWLKLRVHLNNIDKILLGKC